MIIACSLADPFHKAILVRVLNLEHFPVNLKTNYSLGELQPVLQVETLIDRIDDPLRFKSSCCS